MASSVSSVALVPVTSLTTRSMALRPIEAGVAAAFDADALRRDQALRTETVGKGRAGGADEPREGANSRQATSQPAPGQTTPTGNAAFVTQLLAQDQPAERRRTSFADVALAYGRFRKEPAAGFVLDLPQRIDVKV